MTDTAKPRREKGTGGVRADLQRWQIIAYGPRRWLVVFVCRRPYFALLWPTR